MEGQEIHPGAVVPAQASAPPEPPGRPTVDITGAREALVVGPDDLLVIVCPADSDTQEMRQMADALAESGLDRGRFLLVAGVESIAKVQKASRG